MNATRKVIRVRHLLQFVVMTLLLLLLLLLGSPPTTVVLAFSLTAKNGGDPPTCFSFRDKQLQAALEIYDEAQVLAKEGKHKEACDSYMTAIFWGRSTVQKLQPISENNNNNNNNNDERILGEEKDLDDPKVALDWLVSSYLECCHCHVMLEDWSTARADAWAACSYSQNTNIQALESMWQICQKTDDLLGEFQTLNLMRPVLLLQEQQSGSSLAPATSSSSLSLEAIEQRIQAVTAQLEQKFRSSDRRNE